MRWLETVLNGLAWAQRQHMFRDSLYFVAALLSLAVLIGWLGFLILTIQV
jgi:hypothetical protein